MKRVSLLIAFISVVQFSFGQFEIGPKIGYNHVFVSYSPSNASTLLPKASGAGFNVGLFAQYNLSEGLFAGGDVLISSRAYNEVLVEDNTIDDIRVKSEKFSYYSPLYLDIPLFFKYTIDLKGSRYASDKLLGFYIGPVASIFMSGSGVTEETTRVELFDQVTVLQSETVLSKSEVKEYFNPFHLGVNVGVQYSLSMGLNFDLRYQQSLMPTNRDVLSDYGKIGNGMLQFSIGFNLLGSQY